MIIIFIIGEFARKILLEDRDMDINTLLKGQKCSCGKHHVCDIKYVSIGKGAISALEEMTKEYTSILLVADENTYRAAGEKVLEALPGKQLRKVIFSGATVLIPDEKAIEQVQAQLEGVELIIGIGSGVIQDLCKYVTHVSRIPYYIVATAPSMDGYASSGAAMILGGMKVTVSAGVPTAILADTDVLKAAPMDMLQAGYGDIVGKYSCLNDWKLSALINDEYFCQEVYDLTYQTADRVRNLAQGILRRDEEAVGALMEALVVVGIAMAYVGNSRPASGSEHHFSHYFEITGILNGTPYLAHGIDVAYAAVLTAGLRQKLLASRPERRPFDEAQWKRDVERIYRSSAEEVVALQKKLGWYWTDNSSKVLPKWEKIRAVLEESPSEAQMLAMVEAVGLDYQEFVKLYGQEKIDDGILYGKDLKDRYSVLWLYYEFFR